jgi:hypothetical protein
MPVCSECCVLSGRGLCVGPITRPEQSYRVWCVSECDREASRMRRPWPTRNSRAMGVVGYATKEVSGSAVIHAAATGWCTRRHCFSLPQAAGVHSISSYQVGEDINPLKTKGNLFYIRIQCVPRCKHSLLRL